MGFPLPFVAVTFQDNRPELNIPEVSVTVREAEFSRSSNFRHAMQRKQHNLDFSAPMVKILLFKGSLRVQVGLNGTGLKGFAFVFLGQMRETEE